MMTREEILEIDAYCQEHKVSYRQRLEELGIPFWNFYKAKKKYRLQDEAAATDGNMSGGFVQIGTGGGFVPAMPPSRNNRSASKAKQSDVPAESYVTVELRTPNGTSMRIQGSMTKVKEWNRDSIYNSQPCCWSMSSLSRHMHLVTPFAPECGTSARCQAV